MKKNVIHIFIAIHFFILISIVILRKVKGMVAG